LAQPASSSATIDSISESLARMLMRSRNCQAHRRRDTRTRVRRPAAD
jgi:hypothetical protein